MPGKGKRKAPTSRSSTGATAKKSCETVEEEKENNNTNSNNNNNNNTNNNTNNNINHPEELCCDVCTDLYTDPKMLQCFHTYCSGCIDGIRKHGDNRNVTCPKCRHITKAGKDGKLELWRDHIAEQKVKWHQMSETRDKQTLNCSDHETETATGLCTTCQVKLCEFCTSYHQRSARFKGHVVRSVEVVSNEELFDKQPIKCTTHNEEMKYFCEDCQESICGECVLSKRHKSHVFGSLDEVMKKEVTALKKSLKSSENVTKVYNEYLESAKGLA